MNASNNHTILQELEGKPNERRLLLSEASPRLTPALFLDRDGVLIREKNYIRDPHEVELCPGALTLLKHANDASWPVVVITNQSGIARGYFSWDQYNAVTQRILELVGGSTHLAAIYANGHGPNAEPTSWRKPSPTMLFEAARDLNLDLKYSILIGDRYSDLEAGARAGLKTLVHVLTGHGIEERHQIKECARQNWPASSQYDCPELILLDSLLAFPHSLLRRNR